MPAQELQPYALLLNQVCDDSCSTLACHYLQVIVEKLPSHGERATLVQLVYNVCTRTRERGSETQEHRHVGRKEFQSGMSLNLVTW